ncbi:hypothetical protein SSP531S_26830 [Streptomyces spongiicola]|uniref:DUF2530 domain-containing protein n=1 Tax=Streptomyces spongiicola TaxID=1690221 RepID=A0A2S1YV67_9ACTN|nr:DUF6343 family protein [Streptomyces spongiicola]AWK07989.1 hypothetical protein DDQ41_02505 [Streptomyces spongiicola]GBQ01250.1 hypothetical protein SSP531S_26830 [Streptomyces spongiicola]
MRTGNEPATARSPLRMRFWLGVWGLLWAVSGTAVFALAERPGWAITCAVLSLVVMTDLMIVVHRLHQGPHFQPGHGVPPYEPDRGNDRRRR